MALGRKHLHTQLLSRRSVPMPLQPPDLPQPDRLPRNGDALLFRLSDHDDNLRTLHRNVLLELLLEPDDILDSDPGHCYLPPTVCDVMHLHQSLRRHVWTRQQPRSLERALRPRSKYDHYGQWAARLHRHLHMELERLELESAIAQLSEM